MGAIVGGTVEFTNQMEFTGELGAAQEYLTGTGFYPSAYHQCSPSYKESKPGTGCF